MGKPGKKSRSRSSRAVASDYRKPGNDASRTANPYSGSLSTIHDAEQLNPQTCCSNCRTIFEVSVELLGSSDTRVRCGECLSIFDALANLRDSSDDDLLLDSSSAFADAGAEGLAESGSGLPGGLSDRGSDRFSGDVASLDVTYSDFNLFSGDAELPEVPYNDDTRDVTGLDFDELDDGDHDESYSEALYAQDPVLDARSTLRQSGRPADLSASELTTDVGIITDSSPPVPLKFEYREREVRTAQSERPAHPEPELTDDASLLKKQPDVTPKSPTSKGGWLLRGLLGLLVLLLAGGLYTYRERDNLPNNPVVRPLLEKGCAVFQCTLPPRVDLRALRAVGRTVVSHPTLPNALIIRFGIQNEATFEQPFPTVEIRLTDRAGRLVVTNRFPPAEYVKGWEAGDRLEPGVAEAVSLTVEDPGKSAISFELDFR